MLDQCVDACFDFNILAGIVLKSNTQLSGQIEIMLVRILIYERCLSYFHYEY